MSAMAWAWALAWACALAWAGAPAAARELDPAACAARFDVQRDKIIRTEESREMGARYLSELDVGARAECLRLCCETDSCDVFVFEEKSPGSCYLFNCGPPEDFRCKFTAHGNFSSGVLALSRRLAELQDRQRLALHEQELASLRSPPSSTPSTTPPATSTAAPRPPPPPPLPLLPTGRCSRYQFECRAGGECIAVYNACDGVPQCADGSDEAPELGCPAPATRAAPQVQLPESTEEGAGAAAGGGDAPAEGAEPWPHRLTQAQPQHRHDSANAAGGSHIFSHKGGLLQDGAFEAPRAPWPQRAWQPPGEAMAPDRAWGGYARLDWPDVEPRRAWPVPPPRPEPELPLYVPSKTMPEMPMVYSSQQQTLRDGPKKGFELMSKVPAPPPATAPPAPAAPPPPAHKPPHVDNATKKKALVNVDNSIENPQLMSGHWTPTQAERKMAHGAVVLEAHTWPLSEHDGLSDHPPAAVLLLVLGSLLTAALGAMLACRARAARRRRRAHPRLALDADYLVNGMYL